MTRSKTRRAHAISLPPELSGSLDRLDALLRTALEEAEAWLGVAPGQDGFRGLYVRRGDVERSLSTRAGTTPHDVAPRPGGGNGSRLAPDLDAHAGSPLAWLASAYRLSPFDVDVLLLALAPEVDGRYEQAFSFLQDDVTRKRPTVELALRLLCQGPADRLEKRGRLTGDAPLLRHRLLHPDDTPGSELSAGLRVDPQVTCLLLGVARADARLGAVLSPAPSADGWDGVAPEGALEGLARTLSRSRGDGATPLRVLLQGAAGTGKSAAAALLSSASDRSSVALDLAAAVDAHPRLEDFTEILHLAFREAWFRGHGVLARGLEALLGDGGRGRLGALIAEAKRHPGLVVLTSHQPWRPEPGEFSELIRVIMDPPSPGRRASLWDAGLRRVGRSPAPEIVETLAERFVLSPGQIADAVGQVEAELRVNVPAKDRTQNRERALLFQAARAQGGATLERFAHRIHPRADWGELVLPQDSLDQLGEMRQWVADRHRVLDEWGFGARMSRGRGVTALFTGPSGTGKTMAAEVLARSLEVDLFAVDLAGVISKYIGETEQNLDRVFRAAEDANGLLFFDEADALFGKRSEVRDSHDRYANIEISYLLQKMEAYEGVAILATNLRENLDDAFVRRLAFSVHFPFPDADARLRIWEGIWPTQAPLAEGLPFRALAERFPLSGGNIRNIALAAAHLAAASGAPVERRHLARAVRREYQKLGKDVPEPSIVEVMDGLENGRLSPEGRRRTAGRA